MCKDAKKKGYKFGHIKAFLGLFSKLWSHEKAEIKRQIIFNYKVILAYEY